MCVVCRVQCGRCLSLYNNKPFTRGDRCRRCECHGHATSCVYNSTLDPLPSQRQLGGGGQCVNCTDNTTGNQCETCALGYFRPTGRSMYALDVCQVCNCSSEGSLPSHCQQVSSPVSQSINLSIIQTMSTTHDDVCCVHHSNSVVLSNTVHQCNKPKYVNNAGMSLLAELVHGQKCQNS